MATAILFDNHDNYDFLAKHFDNVVYSPHKSSLFKSWLAGTLEVLRRTIKNDTIVCWYDFQAVMLFWICFFLKTNRRIICLNILLKDKTTKKNKFVSLLYKKALLSKNFKATVSSKEYGEWLSRKLKINIKYTLLHDVYHEYYQWQNFKNVSVEPNSVFCGGRNGRDWNFLFDIAKKTPNVKYNVVLPKSIYQEKESCFLPNMYVQTEIPLSKFMETLCKSKLVCLPLNTCSPAGLIVMFQAAANGKLVLTTDTVTTREYLQSDRGVLLGTDSEEWATQITYYLKHEAIADAKSERLRSFLINECNELQFVNGVLEVAK